MHTIVRRSAFPLIALLIACTAFFCTSTWILGADFRMDKPETPTAVDPAGAGQGTDAPPLTCVVLDAGHGGEDGGAVSATGVVEKEINLAVTLALRDLFEAAGIPVVMTRTEDRLLYDRNVNFQGRKKVLDLAARRLMADQTEGGLFISIHMNAFPQPQYHGMQVWYGVADPRSAEIAASIQRASAAIMPDNTREIKAAGSGIYLLDRIKTPAVLVECGFLSNPDEAERLTDEGYQNVLAAVIFAAVAPHLSTAAGP
jgi:N-acetylmuramoyl-L-alanine amidase